MDSDEKTSPIMEITSTTEGNGFVRHRSDDTVNCSTSEDQNSQPSEGVISESTESASNSSQFLGNAENSINQVQERVSRPLRIPRPNPISRPTSRSSQPQGTPTFPSTTRQGNGAWRQQVHYQQLISMERNPHPQMGYSQYSHSNSHAQNVSTAAARTLHTPPTNFYMEHGWRQEYYFLKSSNFTGQNFYYGDYLLPSAYNFYLTQYPHRHNAGYGHPALPDDKGQNSSTLPFPNRVEYQVVTIRNENFSNQASVLHEGNEPNNMNQGGTLDSNTLNHGEVIQAEHTYQLFPSSETHHTFPANALCLFQAPQQAIPNNRVDVTVPYQSLNHSSVRGASQGSTNTWGNRNPSFQCYDSHDQPLDLSSCSANTYKDPNLSSLTNKAIHQPFEQHTLNQEATSTISHQVDGEQIHSLTVDCPAVGDATLYENISPEVKEEEENGGKPEFRDVKKIKLNDVLKMEDDDN